jgi:hypothetical protein
VATNKPIGSITRGTTNPNRLRRVDRYLSQLAILRNYPEPLVVDLGYGALPTTTIELWQRLNAVNKKVSVVGIEIDPERVAQAKPMERIGLDFHHGGFEMPLPEKYSVQKKVDLVRAMNVLRQYEESEVKTAWSQLQTRLSENGRIVEGTSDEIGRISSWVTLDKKQPLSFSISLRLTGLEKPSRVAERLPKILIHKNIPGEKIYEFLLALDSAWAKYSGLTSFGSSQRFIASARELIANGWPIVNQPKRWRLGEMTINWEAVAPS